MPARCESPEPGIPRPRIEARPTPAACDAASSRDVSCDASAGRGPALRQSVAAWLRTHYISGLRGPDPHWITQRAPASRGRNQLDLAVKRPLPPLLAHAVPHDHPRNVAVGPMMRLVGPTIDHRHAHHLHI